MNSVGIRRQVIFAAMLLALMTLLSASAAHRPPQAFAQASGNEIVLSLDAGQSKVHWTLGSTLHTVHGTFALKRGTLRLDPATGKASGEIVADATSAESGNDSRDKKMHKEILESARYTEVVFDRTAWREKSPRRVLPASKFTGPFCCTARNTSLPCRCRQS